MNRANLGHFIPQNENHFPLSKAEKEVISNFHNLYFRLNEKKSGLLLSWMGYQTGKLPSDLWVYQEMLYSIRPDLIIECGTHHGGSALFLANMLEMLGSGRVITIDLYPRDGRPEHELITYLSGSSTDKKIFNLITEQISPNDRVLVILNSDHTMDHVQAELELYKSLITVGSYLVVEDTFLGGHPSHENFGPGPMKAVKQFLNSNSNFVIDKSLEKFLFKIKRNGFLKRIN